MPTAFVTGANGFIGSHLISQLLERGDRVVGLVRPTSDLSSLTPLTAKYGRRLRLVLGDLRDRASLEAGLEDVDYVYHLGAVLLGKSEQEFRATNVDGTRNLLDAVINVRGNNVQRFLFTSSLAAAGPSEDGTPIDETRPPKPISWYGKSKSDAEVIVKEYAATRGVPTTIVRPVAVYGEREQDLSRGTFPPVNLGLSPRVGFVEKMVSMVYVGDLVQGFIAAAESPRSVGRTYFLSDPAPISSKQLVLNVADAFGTKIRIPLFTPHFALDVTAAGAEFAHEFTRGRPLLTRDKVREVRQQYWVCSPEAAKRDLNWEARTPIKEGMKRSVAHWRDQQKRLQDGVMSMPKGERALQTYTLAVAFGVAVESTAWLAKWYAFTPPWLIFVIIFGVFGGIMGSVSYFLAKQSGWLQFAVGVAIGVGFEIANALWLNLWTFNPESFGRIPGPWIRSIVLGIPAGVMPVAVNAIIRMLYKRRLRIG